MSSKDQGWLHKLKRRWKLDSLKEVIIVLTVFALTGSTIVVVKPYILDFIFDSEEISGWFTVLYYILILPVYNLFLLIYGFIFGKFHFFWKFEKRLLNRMLGSNRKQPK